MKKENDIKLIEEILMDIGLTDEDRCKFIKTYNHNMKCAKQILVKYRGDLLNTVCDSQEKLYRVDCLTKMLDKEGGK